MTCEAGNLERAEYWMQTLSTSSAPDIVAFRQRVGLVPNAPFRRLSMETDDEVACRWLNSRSAAWLPAPAPWVYAYYEIGGFYAVVSTRYRPGYRSYGFGEGIALYHPGVWQGYTVFM